MSLPVDVRLQLEKAAKQRIKRSELPNQPEQAPPDLRFLSELYPLQREILEDPHRFKAITWGRRSGKTWTAVCALMKAALENPEIIAPYITLTADKATKDVWPIILQINREYNLGGIPNQKEHWVKFPNGSCVLTTGCKDKSEIEKFRGGSYGGDNGGVVVIDECGAFPEWLEELVEEILDPKLEEFKCQLWLCGTPNISCSGPFYRYCHDSSKGYKTYRSTVLQNRKYKLWAKASDDSWQNFAKAWFVDYLKRKNRTIDESWTQRVWFGNWVRDNETLVFDITEENIFDTLPNGEWHHIIGLDPGYKDAFGLIVLAWSRHHPDCYIVDAIAKPGLFPTQQQELVLQYNEKYHPVGIYCDPAGAGGNAMVDQLAQEYRIPIRTTTKLPRAQSIDLVSRAMKRRKIKIHKSLSELIEQFKKLVWVDKARGLLDEKTPDHLLDAFRYAHHQSRHYFSQAKDSQYKPKSKEAEEIDEYFEKQHHELIKSEQDQAEFNMFM